VPRLSFNEGDNVVLLEQGTDPSCWTGFSFDSGQRVILSRRSVNTPYTHTHTASDLTPPVASPQGLIDIDYFRYALPDGGGKEEASTDFMPLIELLSRSDLMIITVRVGHHQTLGFQSVDCMHACIRACVSPLLSLSRERPSARRQTRMWLSGW
jgi:hypothetical protein